MPLSHQRPFQRGSAALWLVAVAAISLVIIISLFSASRSARLRSQGYTTATQNQLSATAEPGDDDTAPILIKKRKVGKKDEDPAICRVTTSEDKDATIPESGINCGEDCEGGPYTVNSDVTVYVHPADGYEFDKWVSIKNCQACVNDKSPQNPCVVPVHPVITVCQPVCKKGTSPAPSP